MNTNQDRTELAQLVRMLPRLADRELPGDRHRQLQELVMTQIHQHLRTTSVAAKTRRRPVFATSAAVAVGAAAAVAVGVVASGGGGSGDAVNPPLAAVHPVSPHISTMADTFERAADYAAARPFTAPRPDQWIYLKEHGTDHSTIGREKGVRPDLVTENWISVDGTKTASRENGRLQVFGGQYNEYPKLAKLPTDPQVLLAQLRAELVHRFPNPGGVVFQEPGTEAQIEDALFLKVSQILELNLLPPDVTAALWRATALIPGVTQAPGTINVGGHRVIAVGRVQEGWHLDQLLLDAGTYDFVGYRSVATKTTTVDVGNEHIRVPKGEVQYTITRLAAAVVDHPGQTH